MADIEKYGTISAVIFMELIFISKIISLFIFRKDKSNKFAFAFITTFNVIIILFAVYFGIVDFTDDPKYSIMWIMFLIFMIVTIMAEWKYHKESNHTKTTKFFVFFDLIMAFVMSIMGIAGIVGIFAHFQTDDKVNK